MATENLPIAAEEETFMLALRPRVIAVPAEDPLDWEDHANGILASYQPKNALEQALATRIAELLWRLRRVARSEADAIANHQANIDDRYRHQRETFAENPHDWDDPGPPEPAPALLPPTHDAAHIIRYESHINRQLTQTMHELEALQSRRHGKSTPLSRVDFLSLARER